MSKDETAPEPEKNFALNVASTDVDAEMERRRKRAARFNMGSQADADAGATEATADSDATKLLERAKKFGAGSTAAIGKLDQALSSERQRGRRGGEASTEESKALEDPGLKRSFHNKGRFNGRKRGGPGKPTGIAKPSSSPYASKEDREAAERRKKKFAQS